MAVTLRLTCRLRQLYSVITARRALIRVRRHWYPIMLELHKLMVATSRIEVNHDGYGGTTPDAMIWDKGSVLKPRASYISGLSWITLTPRSQWISGQLLVWLVSPITQKDVAVWTYSVSILLEFSSFLATLHWPQDAADMGKFGISYFELLIMFEQHAGHRLTCEKASRPTSVHTDPCFIPVSLPALGTRSGKGASFFMVCSGHLTISLRGWPDTSQSSAHHTRLLHVGWRPCGHGLSSRPRESCDWASLGIR